MSDKWARASLRITSETLCCEAISELLKAEASFAADKGEAVSRRSPQAGVREFSTWLWESGAGTGEPLERHLALLLPFVESHTGTLERLASDCTLEIVCGFSSGTGQGGVAIDHDVLSKFAQARLSLLIDLYPPEREG